MSQSWDALREKTSKSVARLREDIEALKDLGPFVSLLSRVATAGVQDMSVASKLANVVQQSGFEDLHAIHEKRDPPPTCCICLEQCIPERNPTFTPCVHLACKQCFTTLLVAHRHMVPRHGIHGGGNINEAPCPLCRNKFQASDLIHIISEKIEGKEKEKGKAKEIQDTRHVHVGEGSSSLQPSSSVAAAPSFSSACTKEELDAIPLPELVNQQRSSAKFPAFSTRLLSHLACASGCKLNAKKTDSSLSHNRSPKVRAVLRNLKIIFRTSSIAIPKVV